MSVWRHNLTGSWCYDYRDLHTGKRRVKQGLASKAEARTLSDHARERWRAVRRGTQTPSQATAAQYAAVPLADQLADYLDHLKALRRCAKHLYAVRRLAKLIAVADFTVAAQVTADRVWKAVDAYARLPRYKNQRAPGDEARRDLVVRFKAFLNWMVDNDRLPANPIGRMKLPKPVEKRHPRRQATDAEFAALEAAALDGRAGGAWTPLDRWAYVVLLRHTGLRSVIEAGSLTPERLRLGGTDPTAFVPAAYTKNRDEASQPIPRDVAKRLTEWLAGKAPGKPVFPMGGHFQPAKMLRRLCVRAKVPYRTDAGFLDGHALRHTYVSAVAQVSDLETARQAARHKSAATTLRYLHTTQQRVRDAIEGSQK